MPYRPDPPGRRFSRSLSAKRAVRFSEDTALSHRRSRPRSVARDTYDGQEARTNEFFRAYMSAKFFVKRFRESQKIEDLRGSEPTSLEPTALVPTALEPFDTNGGVDKRPQAQVGLAPGRSFFPNRT